jgi:hypothetical protein
VIGFSNNRNEILFDAADEKNFPILTEANKTRAEALSSAVDKMYSGRINENPIGDESKMIEKEFPVYSSIEKPGPVLCTG